MLTSFIDARAPLTAIVAATGHVLVAIAYSRPCGLSSRLLCRIRPYASCEPKGLDLLANVNYLEY